MKNYKKRKKVRWLRTQDCLTGEKRAKYGLKAYTIYYRYSIYLIIYIVKNEESRNQL